TDLRIGDRSRLTMAESSQLTIREITQRVHRFRLERSLVKADYKLDGERVLRIESAGSVADPHAARFSLVSTGTSVAIGTADGVAAEVAPDGRFRVPVAHAADGREVLVALRDASGHEETRRVRCVDPPPRIRDFAIHWRKQTP